LVTEASMMRSAWLRGLLTAMGPALGLALAMAGCGPQITTRGGGDGGSGGEGGGGEGGGEGGGGDTSSGTCTEYLGDGCTPGDTREGEYCPIGEAGPFYAQDECYLDSDCHTQWAFGGCDTPLVLSFDGADPELVADPQHGFTLSAGLSQVTDWPTARTPWLALDRDGSAAIEDGSELFGSMSPMAGGGRVPHGFAALAELDANCDGLITAADPAFSRLVVWADRDGDRTSSSAELSSLGERGIIALELAFTRASHCDARGNCGIERASFRFADAGGAERSGMIIDLHLARQRGR
jgi:hypothetical protein